MQSQEETKLSTIITLYKRIDLMLVHLRECMNSTFLSDEIIIINDGGDEKFKDILFTIPRKVKIIYARIDQDIIWNVNGARNLGAWLSSGDILSFEDTDIIPDHDLYKNAIKIFRENPSISRVCFNRKAVDIKNCLENPMENWKVIATLGQCQASAILRRKEFLKLKGLDERFAGHCGWMEYDWKRRYVLAGVKSQLAPYAWAVFDNGEPNVLREMSRENWNIHAKAKKQGLYQHPNGILNFTYKFEEWDKNI